METLKKIFSLLGLLLILCGQALGADTTTPSLGLTKPAIGSASWAPKINTDLDILDAAIWPVINVMTYGVVGDGVTDDTAAFQAAIDAAPDFSTLLIPAATKIRTTAAVNIVSRAGLKIVGGGSNGGVGLNTGFVSQIYYDGANDGVVLNVDGSRELAFENFTVNANAKAVTGIQFKSVSGSQAVTFNRMQRLSIYAGSPARSDFIAIDICSTGATNNCELFTMQELVLNGATAASGSIGIKIGHTNALTHTITESGISSFAMGIYNNNGSARIANNLFDANAIDIASSSPDTMMIEFNRTERAKQFYKALSSGGLVWMIGNRFGTPDATPGTWIDFSTGVGWTLMFVGNVFSGTPFVEVAPFGGSPAGQLVSIGNIYDSRHITSGAVTTWSVFSNIGYTSLNDSTTDGLPLTSRFNAGALIAGGLKTTGAASGKKVVCVDTSTGQLYASSTGVDCSN